MRGVTENWQLSETLELLNIWVQYVLIINWAEMVARLWPQRVWGFHADRKWIYESEKSTTRLRLKRKVEGRKIMSEWPLIAKKSYRLMLDKMHCCSAIHTLLHTMNFIRPGLVADTHPNNDRTQHLCLRSPNSASELKSKATSKSQTKQLAKR